MFWSFDALLPLSLRRGMIMITGIIIGMQPVLLIPTLLYILGMRGDRMIIGEYVVAFLGIISAGILWMCYTDESDYPSDLGPLLWRSILAGMIVPLIIWRIRNRRYDLRRLKLRLPLPSEQPSSKRRF